MIRRRVGQFAAAMLAKVTEQDKEYVASYLSDVEQKLFYAVSIPDQKHAIRVARTAERLIRAENVACDKRLTVRSALLHDVGRTRRDMGTSGKVISVLLRACFGTRIKSWRKKNLRRKGLRHVIYVYYEHPKIGAEMLRAIGDECEAAIIEKHHSEPKADEPIELTLLRRADELN